MQRTRREDEEKWKDDDFLSFGAKDSEDKIPADDIQKGPQRRTSTGSLEAFPARRSSSTANPSLPPWMERHTDFRRVPPLVALHNEIVDFCNLISPFPEERKERKRLADRFTALATKTFGEGKCRVEIFGSQVTGLYLPTSDIDIVIVLEKGNEDDEEEDDDDDLFGDNEGASSKSEEDGWKEHVKLQSPLEKMADALCAEWRDELSYLEVIANTKVPLVKFTHAPTDISVDVSFEIATGTMAASLINKFLAEMPPLRPLTLVMKYFLSTRGLKEPYTGGVGAFMLQLMIVSFLQQREREAYVNGYTPSMNLGCLLLEFLELYGTRFNCFTTGISVRGNGTYFPKGASDRSENFTILQRPFSLAIENPMEPTFDVGKSSFRFNMVQRSFAAAYKTLLAHVATPIVSTNSILGTILPVSEDMTKRGVMKRSAAKLDAPLSSNRKRDSNNGNNFSRQKRFRR